MENEERGKKNEELMCGADVALAKRGFEHSGFANGEAKAGTYRRSPKRRERSRVKERAEHQMRGYELRFREPRSDAFSGGGG